MDDVSPDLAGTSSKEAKKLVQQDQIKRSNALKTLIREAVKDQHGEHDHLIKTSSISVPETINNEITSQHENCLSDSSLESQVELTEKNGFPERDHQIIET